MRSYSVRFVKEIRSPRSIDVPSFFTRGELNVRLVSDVDLILGGVRWQYGFEIDDQHVLGEYAYHYPRGRQALVLRRERNGQLDFGPTLRSSGHTLARLVRSNALLLSVAGAAADDSADKRLQLSSLIGPLFAWFRTSLRLMEPRNREPRIAVTADRVRSPEARGDVLALLRAADLGIKRTWSGSNPISTPRQRSC